MYLVYFLITCFLFPYHILANSSEGKELLQPLSEDIYAPFEYDLSIVDLEGIDKTDTVLIAFHGLGGSNELAYILRQQEPLKGRIISFNFPDALMHPYNLNPHLTSFGTFKELIPPLYILKKVVIDENIDMIDLYGISAGGGVIVNLLSVLNTPSFEEHLMSLGITLEMKQKILAAIQRGFIILDCPMKSPREVMDHIGFYFPLKYIVKRYEDNRLNPIDNLGNLQGLRLNILVHFQNPDEILSNRDDNLYIERLKASNNAGITEVVIGNDGGHSAHHNSLWNAVPGFIQKINNR